MLGLLGCLVLAPSLVPAPVGADPAANKRAEARRVGAQLEALGRNVEVLAEQIDAGRLRAGELASEAAAAERDLAKAEAKATGAKSRLAAEAVDTYVQGGIDLGGVEPVDGDGDPLRRRQYAMTLQAQKADLLDAARAQAAIVREKRARLNSARARADGAVTAVEQAQRDAASAVSRLETASGRIDGELAGLVEEEREARAEAEATEVQRSLAARNPASPVASLAARPAAPTTVRAPVTPGSPTALPTARPAPDAGNEAPAPNPGAAAAVAEARRQIGKPYQWAGSGPDTFDCSGLTAWAWKAGGRTLPHSSGAQFASLPRVNSASAQPGDLFAFGSPIHHIGIYIGGGTMIAAPQTGKNVQYQPAYRTDLTGVVRP